MAEVISVSKWQGDIEWDKVKAAGVKYAFSRTGEGATYKDPYFITNFTGAGKAGIDACAWHLWRALSSTPEQQEQSIVNSLTNVGFAKNNKLAIVVSTAGNEKATAKQMGDNLAALLELLDKHTFLKNNVLIKTNIDTWKNHLDHTTHANVFIKHELWVQQWKNTGKPDVLTPWGENKWRLWEFSKSGKVDGISGDVLVTRINPQQPKDE